MTMADASPGPVGKAAGKRDGLLDLRRITSRACPRLREGGPRSRSSRRTRSWVTSPAAPSTPIPSARSRCCERSRRLCLRARFRVCPSICRRMKKSSGRANPAGPASPTMCSTPSRWRFYCAILLGWVVISGASAGVSVRLAFCKSLRHAAAAGGGAVRDHIGARLTASRARPSTRSPIVAWSCASAWPCRSPSICRLRRSRRRRFKKHGDGSGDIPLALKGNDKIAWLHLWPHTPPVADGEARADAQKPAQCRPGRGDPRGRHGRRPLPEGRAPFYRNSPAPNMSSASPPIRRARASSRRPEERAHEDVLDIAARIPTPILDRRRGAWR